MVVIVCGVGVNVFGVGFVWGLGVGESVFYVIICVYMEIGMVMSVCVWWVGIVVLVLWLCVVLVVLWVIGILVEILCMCCFGVVEGMFLCMVLVLV